MLPKQFGHNRLVDGRWAYLLAYIATQAGWHDVARCVGSAFCQWYHMIHRQLTGLCTTVGAAITISGFQRLPLGSREIIDRGVPSAGFAEIIVGSYLVAVGLSICLLNNGDMLMMVLIVLSEVRSGLLTMVFSIRGLIGIQFRLVFHGILSNIGSSFLSMFTCIYLLLCQANISMRLIITRLSDLLANNTDPSETSRSIFSHSKVIQRFLLAAFAASFHLACRSLNSSIIRRTNSATGIPRRAASCLRKSIWGAVNETICFSIPIGYHKVSMKAKGAALWA
jgi:hypothetical protein